VTGVAAIVPARDEQDRVAATVRALRDAGLDEVVVVDDGSGDATAARAMQAGARVVRSQRNRGKGAALRAGIRVTDADVIVFVDADLGDTARVARALVDRVLSGDADMTIAAPPPSGPRGFGLVERFSRWGIRRGCGFDARRPLSGQRALRRAVVERCAIADRFGVETALTIDAVRAGFRVAEVELRFDHARTERSAAGFRHRARQGVDVLRVVVPRLVRRR
jgi:glycosyltransferase involved in cell wall biosynthesis